MTIAIYVLSADLYIFNHMYWPPPTIQNELAAKSVKPESNHHRGQYIEFFIYRRKRCFLKERTLQTFRQSACSHRFQTLLRSSSWARFLLINYLPIILVNSRYHMYADEYKYIFHRPGLYWWSCINPYVKNFSPLVNTGRYGL